MFVMHIANIKEFRSIIIVLACSVDFQFNTEITIRITVENRFGLVTVFVNRCVFAYSLITFMTKIFIIVLISIIVVNKCIAFLATGVVIIVTVLTKRCIVVTLGIIVPDSCTAAVADRCVIVKAVGA
ncbi:MAG: hypothetical protein IJY19_09570 [Ruminococcus sp.]|nr:hypothetical protein [Ruminococcus sp.]